MKNLIWRIKRLPFFWNFINRPATKGFRDIEVEPELEKNGIWITSVHELGIEHSFYEILKALEQQKAVEKVSARKPYLEKIVPDLMIETSRASMVRDAKVVADAYLGMRSKVYDMNINRTFPVTTARTGSQNWHRDGEDIKICKMFVYFTDVDAGAGPFEYVQGSQKGGKYAHLFPHTSARSVYPPPGAVEEAIDEADIVSCTGKAGTVIFADTAGLHRGGYATEKERIMLTINYGSLASRYNV